eukprot:CAMPEP_0170435272 /NCGR_PEP_ID=MMETSP0117_2-20130122/43510_1 /TAXON_ID=400756 /ORGANISM="Durinskia baltica, Strain CSIRO CS-38" /LENGTH=83 /DNA_ID=CAMNT_0010695211 /DNA_START=90 /DNA_END=338 /DNA_ORIENTATION=+
MALAASKLPVSMAHSSGEIDCVPTCTLSIHKARCPRGAQATALLNCLAEFALMAFITMVEPSVMTRTRILEMRLKDQRKASSA